MCQKKWEPRTYMYVSVKAGGTLNAPQTLSLDWAVSKRQNAWEHHKDGGARIVHSRLCQRLTVSTRQVPESTMPLLYWAVSICIHHCYAGWC